MYSQIRMPHKCLFTASEAQACFASFPLVLVQMMTTVRDDELAFRSSSASVRNENVTFTDRKRIAEHNKSVSCASACCCHANKPEFVLDIDYDA